MTQLVNDWPPGQYFQIAAASTTAAIGNTGAVGDYLESIIFTAGATPTICTLFDGANTVMTFTPTATTTTSFPIRAYSKVGKWNITTGTNTTATCVGRFT